MKQYLISKDPKGGTVYRLEYITNNPKAAAQVGGAMIGVTLGWLIMRSPAGGLIGGIIGLTLATLLVESMEHAKYEQISLQEV